MEHFEWMDTMMTDLLEWEDFEADMATNPYSDCQFCPFRREN